MKICIVSPRSPRLHSAGIENITMGLARALQKEKHSVEICCIAPKRLDSEFMGIKVKEFPPSPVFGSLNYSRELLGYLKKSGFSIVHAHGINNGTTLATLMAKKQKQKLVLSFDSSGSSTLTRKIIKGAFYAFVRLLKKRIDRYICLSEFEKRHFKKILGEKEEKFEVIPFGEDEREIAAVRGKTKNGTIVSVGRLVKNKGFQHLIRAAGTLKRRGTDFRVEIIGKGPYRKDLEELAKSEGVHDKISFTEEFGLNERGKYLKKLREAEIFALLSDYESQGIVVTEAIGMEKPVLVKNSTALGDHVKNFGVTGIKDPSDTEKLAETLEKILENPKKFRPKNTGVTTQRETNEKTIRVYETLLNRGIKICMLGEFDKNLIFNRTVIEGLEKNGCKIVFRNAAEKKFGAPRKLRKLLFILGASDMEADIYYVPFPARNYGLAAKMVSLLTGKPLVIDFLVSDYANRKFEHKTYQKNFAGTAKKTMDYLMDYLTFNSADLVLVDTEENGKWFSELFGSKKRKWSVKHFGESVQLFKPTKLPKTREFRVLYFLGYLPTHNAPYVLEAAKLLEKDREIRFILAGNGPEKNKSIRKAEKLGLENVEFLDHVPYSRLPGIIGKSHVILGGPFTRSEKADKVVTSKTFTGMACARPVIVGKTPCTSRFFRGNEDCVVFVDTKKPSDFEEKLRQLKNNRKKAETIGRNAYRLFIRNYTPEKIGKGLKERLLEISLPLNA